MIKSGDYFVYTGSVHIHTTDSDGSKSLEEVAEIASSVNLDFILVSDHMTLKSRQAGKEGFYGGTFAAIGYEHNDNEDCNHYLLFETGDVLSNKYSAQEYVAEGRRQGALGIIAHPDEVRPRVGRFPSYPWLAWDAKGFDGIEIWNQMSEWMENLNTFNRVKMLFSPRKFMKSPTDRILQIWDELNLTGKIAGVGGVDVHAYPYRLGPFRITIFPYKVQFKSIRTHLLLPDELSRNVKTARKQVFDAIRDCRVFISNHRWGDAAGFEFKARQGSEMVTMGGSLKNHEDSIVTAKVPDRAIIRLIANGKSVLESNGDYLEYHPSGPGLFRVEAFKNKKGWIYSNHIKIGNL